MSMDLKKRTSIDLQNTTQKTIFSLTARLFHSNENQILFLDIKKISTFVFKLLS
jgi:hypothetical protein